MNITVRKYSIEDLSDMIQIWNEVVEDGIAFPQEECLNEETGKCFFESQSYCAVAEDTVTKKIYGLYILHPNNVGRCGHICNSSYAVNSESRGLHIGEKLVLILSRLVDTFSSRILYPMLLLSGNHSIAVV